MKDCKRLMGYWNFFFLIFFSAGSLSQSVSTLHGIKITSPSSFDPQTHTVKLTFMNDSPANITAWGYCIKVENATGSSTPQHGFCGSHDALFPVIEQKLEVAKRPFLSEEPGCGDGCRFVHPGQTETVVQDYSWSTEVVNAGVEINFVVYANGVVEALSSEQAQTGWRAVAATRKAFLDRTLGLARKAQEILSDGGNQHPAVAMTDYLRQMAAINPQMEGELNNFKKPEWRKGNDQEFIPADERSYLQQYASDKETWAAELAKNQIDRDQTE